MDKVTIVGEGVFFDDGGYVDKGSDAKFSDVNAHLLYIDLSSSAIIIDSEIELLSCSESRIQASQSSLGVLDGFECSIGIANSTISDITIYDSTLKVTNSEVSGEVGYGYSTNVYFGNSGVTNGFIDLDNEPNVILKCMNVINTNFDSYQSNCSLAP